MNEYMTLYEMTKDMDEDQINDIMCIIGDSRVVEITTHDELIKNCEDYYECKMTFKESVNATDSDYAHARINDGYVYKTNFKPFVVLDKDSRKCKGCGSIVVLPNCFENCKKYECEHFSDGYCYTNGKDLCAYGVNGSHEFFLDINY
jgi:hypothetical protein